VYPVNPEPKAIRVLQVPLALLEVLQELRLEMALR